ncbi:MAG TPA: DUF1361 domain-containing protein [Candidatus Limnocylindrales bacterium]|nr:DUF1361 domain-containing protein [Candidatus Limnocylindrales bacterium]
MILPARFQVGGALLLASVVSVGLYVGGVLRGDGENYSYMLWNLFLGWLPLLFIARLLSILRHKRWSSWEGIGVSVLWLFFLPNSFYMVSDLIHLRNAPGASVLYDAVMLLSFILTGLLLGYTSLFLFHMELRKRLRKGSVRVCLALIFLLCSFAIYLGRELDWNSWDILFNPAGLLFDVSDRVIHPLEYLDMFGIVVPFFVLLSTFYVVCWQVARALRRHPSLSLSDL